MAPVQTIFPEDHMVAVVYGLRIFMLTIDCSLLYSTCEPSIAILLRLRWHLVLKLQTTLLMMMSIVGGSSSGMKPLNSAEFPLSDSRMFWAFVTCSIPWDSSGRRSPTSVISSTGSNAFNSNCQILMNPTHGRWCFSVLLNVLAPVSLFYWHRNKLLCMCSRYTMWPILFCIYNAAIYTTEIFFLISRTGGSHASFLYTFQPINVVVLAWQK